MALPNFSLFIAYKMNAKVLGVLLARDKRLATVAAEARWRDLGSIEEIDEQNMEETIQMRDVIFVVSVDYDSSPLKSDTLRFVKRG